jgi:hypothetical protein
MSLKLKEKLFFRMIKYLLGGGLNMMKKKIFTVCLLLIPLLVTIPFSACSSGGITAALGEQFMLYADKTSVITGESLKIEFVEVTADSRCPIGIECLVAGDAKCLMLISYFNSQTSLTFTQQGSDDNTMDFNVFKITYQLQPYPLSGDTINAADYRLKMTVTKTVK